MCSVASHCILHAVWLCHRTHQSFAVLWLQNDNDNGSSQIGVGFSASFSLLMIAINISIIRGIRGTERQNQKPTHTTYLAIKFPVHN